MKILKTAMLCALMIGLSYSDTYAYTPEDSGTNSLRNKIVELIVTPDYKISECNSAKIWFIVNDNNEIEVLNVGTRSRLLGTYIKNRLNNQKIDVTGIQKNIIYSLKFTQELI